jgi:NADH-quinone oxidoreductase subunit L
VVIAPPLPGFPSISLPEASMALPVATVLMLLVFGGAVGKSAQFPLHVWLPDAMEGPTPVSALIHAATMVAAGVYLVARTFPLFASAAHEGISPAMLVVALIGAVTALMAATIGLAQFDIKRVLAYSTISQLGYMIMALGIGAYVAAVFHLITHAFFKALLFLGSGSVIHGLEHGLQHAGGHASAEAAQAQGPLPGAADPRDPNDMRNMGGLRQRMPITFWTFLAGSLALTGIPVFAGFWSKDEILAEAFHKGLEGGLPIAALVWLFGTVAAFFTATYMARQVFMVFGGPAQTEAAAHAPESRPAMTAPLVILAVFAVVLGLVGVPATFPGLGAMLGNPFHRFVGTFSFSGLHTEALEFNIVPAAISVAAAAGGWGAGWLIYGRRPAQARQRDPLRALGLLWTLLNRKYFMDELYGLLVVRASVAFAAANAFVDQKLVDGAVNATGFGGELFSRVNGWIDTHIVDGIVNLVAVVTREMARAVRVIQTGQVQNYLLLVFFGLMFLVGAVLTR